jgi:hypothetical protein
LSAVAARAKMRASVIRLRALSFKKRGKRKDSMTMGAILSQSDPVIQWLVFADIF